MCRPTVVGQERVPTEGPLLLAANHSSWGETVLLPAMTNRVLTFAAKQELFTARGPMRLVGMFLRAVGIRPMDRSGGRASASSMSAVLEPLLEGGAIALFPEGTRAPDDRLYKGKTGVARLALGSGAPVVPVGLLNTRPVRRRFPPITMMWKPVIIFGEPLDFSEWAGGEDDRAVLRHVTDSVMSAIQELTGQTYVDVYAASLKSAQAEGRELVAKEVPHPGYGRPLPQRPADRAAEKARKAAEAAEAAEATAPVPESAGDVQP
ncbi:lysophospholipid acyltransferase family protein [Microlunatus sp. Y2014]|uniref:lysophospholipid acyltransferase family protein n=1 Tax=Microlunatus sp. Y2014 TaxID=3418488 RepID=UPI003DA756BD